MLSRSPLLTARVRMAWEVLRMDVRLELFRLGADVSDDSVDAIINGLPGSVLYVELARRT